MVGFFIIVALLLVALFALYWRWRQRIEAEINEGVEVDWAHFQKHEPEFLGGMTKEQFRDVYARVHTPRFPGYALATVASFCAALPLSFALLAGGLMLADALGLTPQPASVANQLLIEDGQMRFLSNTPPEAALYYLEDLSGFYYFFGIIFIWLLIVAFYMRRYHARRPGYLRDEIIRARS
ncbi:MAG: hypothetical protein AAGC77_01375 [Pseudomonadota bacterium]